MSKKICYRLHIRLLAPMSIGSGTAEDTDHDIVRNSLGEPFIPATSIAGVLRGCLDDKTADALFGCLCDDDAGQSAVYVYDAGLVGKSYHTAIRDSVKLDEYRCPVDGAKFNMEVLETGAELVSFLELNECGRIYMEDAEAALTKALSMLAGGECGLGGKSSRGYGHIGLKAEYLAFSIPEMLDAWLAFDMYREEAWANASPLLLAPLCDDTVIRLSLKQLGGISIREYSTKLFSETVSAPDYAQLALYDDTPVIPGTSWAGAFRHRVKELGASDALVDEVFGFAAVNAGEQLPSGIIFQESQLRGGEYKVLTRNAVDRFSGGTKDGALYTERAYFGGSCELEIHLKKRVPDAVKPYLAAAMLDLDNGFLAIGGLTSVGRGLFTAERLTVNGKDRTDALKNCDIGGIL